MKTLCIGFFDRGNFGDQLFAWMYQKCFPEFTIMSIENLTVNEVLEHDVIILAGGDILNDYFMAKLVNLLEMSNFSGSVYAFSSGIPYTDKPKTLKTIMDIFDGVMVRSRRDYEWCKTLTKQVFYHPDVSIFTEELLDHTALAAVDVDSLIGTTDRKRIILTVAQPFYATSPDKDQFLESICNIIRRLINEENGHVYLIPFNTFRSAEKECDYYLQNVIMKHLKDTSEVEHVTNVTREFSMEEMIAIFKSMHLGVHMRYHAHMLSIITGLPFVSLGKTPKTLNLMTDLGLLEDGSWSHVDETTGQHYYAYGTIPDIDFQRSKFAEYTLGYTLDDYKSQVHDWVNSSHSSHNTKRCPLYTAVLKAVEYLRSKCKTTLDYSNHAWVQRVLREPGTFAKIIKSYSIEDIRKDFMASLVCYYLIGTPFPEYHYGLAQKILGSEFMASRELQWIYNDYTNKQYHLSSNVGMYQDMAPRSDSLEAYTKMNLTYVNVNDFNGLHRSGWPFVMASMTKLHNPESNIIFDNYIDRTFHWCHDIYSHVGLIPYKKPWVGVLHHTMNEEYSEYNTTQLLNNPTFIESLQTCKGLIVLSDYLKNEISPLIDVPIVSIKHPTDLNVSKRFDINAFQRDPAVVQVGAWLRNNYSIYALTPIEPWLKKKVLRGKNMNHHFCPNDLCLEIDGSILTGMTNLNISSGTNKFITGMLKHLQEQYQSVHEISTLSNDEYDTLLTNHIVFLDLVDVSAANTVIECIARYTPLVINRHPAVVEYLGEGYPLFYDSIAEANILVCDMDKINEAHLYLRTMYKGDLRCEHFVYQVSKFVSMISANCET